MILGIDLGTSNSLAAAVKDGEVVIVKNKAGGEVIPSVLSVDEQGNIYAGDMAIHRKNKYGDKTIGMFKRSMGSADKFSLNDKEYSARELSAILLKAIKNMAEEYFMEEINEAVISVPAFFNNLQRKAVIDAGKMAGFDVKRIVNEPTAAAVAYGVENTEEDSKVILVLDLGGGTFDISVMEVNGNVMEVIAVCGDNNLGGGDFTRRLIELFKKHHNITKSLSKEEEESLFLSAESAKKDITLEGKATIKCMIDGSEYVYEITESEYEEACTDLIEKIRKLTIRAIEESKYEPSEIKDILMVGGGTKLSIVKKMVEKMIGSEISYIINPEEAVVRGVALYGALMNKDESVNKIVMTDICPHYIGCWAYNGKNYDCVGIFDTIVKKNTTIPVKKTIVHYSWPNTWELSVLQCDNEYGIDAVELDLYRYEVPYLNTGDKVEIHKSTIIDSDGIIYSEVFIPANGMRYGKVVQLDEVEMSKEERENRISELYNFSNNYNEQNEFDELLARGERVYAEASRKMRDVIAEYLGRYEEVLGTGKLAKIKQEAEVLKKFLDVCERG